jgi:hypothetical protein
MPREPTVAQRKFAQNIALGFPKTKAYAMAYPKTTMTGHALAKTASLTAKTKAVKGELERLMAEPLLQPLLMEPCPAARNPEQLREHAVATMLRLSRHGDPMISFHAACWLKDYADAIDVKRKPEEPDRRAILGELRGLYAKALNRAPIVETVVEAVEGEAKGPV